MKRIITFDQTTNYSNNPYSLKYVKTPKPFNEKELLIKLRSGDTIAFEEIYNHYVERLTSKFVRLLKSEELVDDALQDLFSKIWEHRESIDPEKSFPAFIYRLASNLVNDHFRKIALQYQFQDQLKEHYDESFTHIEEELITKENKEIVWEAVKQLPERQREVFILHKFEGKSYKEISEQLNISSSTINKHISNANTLLMELLNPKTMVFLAILASYK